MPSVFSRLPARKVDYLLGLAREALEAREFDRARELVADAKVCLRVCGCECACVTRMGVVLAH